MMGLGGPHLSMDPACEGPVKRMETHEALMADMALHPNWASMNLGQMPTGYAHAAHVQAANMGNMEFAGMSQSEAWKAPAIAAWVGKALKRPPKTPLTMAAMVGEVKHWKPNRLPEGVTAKDYIRVVGEALKSNPLLVYNQTEGTFLPVGVSPAPKSAVITSPGVNTAKNTGTSLGKSDGEFDYWVAEIQQKSKAGEDPLSLVSLKEGVIARSPSGGYVGPTGEVVSTELYYQNLLKSLKALPGMACDASSGKRALRWIGSPSSGYTRGEEDRGAGAAAQNAGFAHVSSMLSNRQHMGAASRRDLRTAAIDVVELTDGAVTYAELSGLGDGGDEDIGNLGSPLDAVGTNFDGDNDESGGINLMRMLVPPASIDTAVNGYFFNSGEYSRPALDHGCGVADGKSSAGFKEAALLGRLANEEGVYLNTHEPFCFVTVGVQGAGKSHTLACVLESCLIPFPEAGVIRLDVPMTALVLHYDQSINSVCEATGLLSPTPLLQRILGGAASQRCVPKERMVVLVSPSYYKQRKAFYGNYCIVKPLLLRWHTLTADHIKRIMRIKDGDNQLYVAALLDLLRRYQRLGVVPNFRGFMSEVTTVCNAKGQEGPLLQRLALLESIVAESVINESILQDGGDLLQLCKPGQLVVVDLTDPLLSSEEANGIFQVLTEQFRAIPTTAGCGKVLALDEAHKYMDGVATDGLSQAIVNTARLMRHDGMRLVLSTQSPRALAPELLELVTVAVLHRFHSSDWFSYLSKKLPLEDLVWEKLISLEPGTAVMFASRHRLPEASSFASVAGGTHSGSSHVFAISVRPRITADRGASKRNVGASSGAGLTPMA